MKINFKIDKGLLHYLKSSDYYLNEAIELSIKMFDLLDKPDNELTTEEKEMITRSSELVALIEVTKCLEGEKQ